MTNRDHVLEQALALPLEDRAYVLAVLRTSLSEEVTKSFADPEFQNEMERRFADSAGTIPWSQLRDEL